MATRTVGSTRLYLLEQKVTTDMSKNACIRRTAQRLWIGWMQQPLVTYHLW